MFNYQQINILYIFFLIYITQTIALLAIFSIYSLQDSNNAQITKIYFVNSSTQFIVNFLILSFAGMPPLLMFFFKVFVFLNVNFTISVLVIFVLVNSCALFYYVNFLVKSGFLKSIKELEVFKRSELFLIKFSVHILIVNTFGFFFFNYFGFFFNV